MTNYTELSQWAESDNVFDATPTTILTGKEAQCEGERIAPKRHQYATHRQVRLPQQLDDKMVAYSMQHGVTLSAIMRQALDNFLG